MACFKCFENVGNATGSSNDEKSKDNELEKW